MRCSRYAFFWNQGFLRYAGVALMTSQTILGTLQMVHLYKAGGAVHGGKPLEPLEPHVALVALVADPPRQ